jgi:hypothetical protein
MPKPLTLAWMSIPMLLAVSLWGWSVDPHRPGRWLFVALFLPALWGFAEWAQPGDRRRERQAILNWHRLCIGGAALLLAFAVASQLAIASGLIDGAWAPAIRRFRGMTFGASLMLWGNYLPKLLSPWSLDDQPFDWQGVHRFAGWGALLGGLAVVLAWLLLPVEEAKSASSVIVVLTLGLAVGRKFLSLAAPPPRGSTPRAGANLG